MGFSDIIPGISGATIALITGIYKELINNIKKVLEIRSINDIKKIPFSFFLPLGIGIIIAILLGANLIGYLLENFASETYALFLGLIIYSSINIFLDIKQKSYYLSLLGIVIGVLISFLSFNLLKESFLVTIALGVVTITAMLLPGISGSYVLLMLGKYEFMINVIRNLDFVNIALFLIGGIIALFLIIRLIHKYLNKYENQTISLLAGLMLGATATVINLIEFKYITILFVILGGIIGYLIQKLK